MKKSRPRSEILAQDPPIPCIGVPAKIQRAICVMVDEGLPIHVAAERAGITTHKLRVAFADPNVLAFTRKRRQMLRESLCSANDHRLAEIRDAANNMPAVNAILALERMTNPEADGRSAPTHAIGVTIQIVSARPDDGQGVLIDASAAAPIDRDAVDVDLEEPEA